MVAYDFYDKDLSVIFGLGLILVGLLSRNFEIPPYSNHITGARRGINSFFIKVKDYPVSSRTLGIIQGCFSKKNRETRLLEGIQKFTGFSPDDDTLYDPPEIFTLCDLIEHIKKAQSVLEKFQLTVQNHQPRQLVPLSLVQLTRKYNPYQDIEDSNETET